MAVKRTVLDMTQEILRAMDSDEINSIGDSNEALDVAYEIRTAYYILLQELESDFQKGIVQLEGLADTTKPTHMKLPENVVDIEWIYYNNEVNSTNSYEEVRYLDPESFIRRSMQMATQTSALEVEDFSGISIYVGTTEQPKYYTTLDDEYIIFDSFNQSLDSTVHNSKTNCMGMVLPEFEVDDDFIPRLRPELFSRLVQEAQSAAFIHKKQVSDSKSEQRSRRLITQQQNRLSRFEAKQPTSRTKNNYGRRQI